MPGNPIGFGAPGAGIFHPLSAPGVLPQLATDCYKNVVIADLPVRYYRLGESSGTVAVDTMGLSDGSYVNTPTLGVASPLLTDGNTAATFLAASAQYADLPAGAGFGNGPWSAEAIVSTGASGANFTILTIPGLIGSSGSIGLKMGPSANGKVSIMDGGNRILTSVLTYNNSVGFHVVATKNAANVYHLYINGVDVGIDDSTPHVATATAGNHGSIGTDLSTGSPLQNFTGTVDEVAYYNYELTKTQVQFHYANVASPCLVTGSPQTISPSAIPSGEAVGAPTVLPGNVNILPTAIAGMGFRDLLVSYGMGAYWRLGESSSANPADDFIGTNDGTYVGGVTVGQAGALTGDADTAVLFNGTTGKVTVPDATALDLADGPFSIVLILKQGATDRIIFSKGAGAYDLGMVGGQLNFGSVALSTRTNLNNSAFHFVVLTKNGASRFVYVDGVDDTTLGTNSTFGDNATALTIGGDGAADFFSGTLDEFAIGKVVLTAQQVADLFAAMSAGIASGVGTPTLTQAANAITILPTAIPSAESVGTPTLLHGNVNILPTAIASAELVGNPTLIPVATILPTSIPSAEAVGNPTLIPGAVVISPTAIVSAESVGTPTLLPVNFIQPSAIPTAESVGTPTLIHGNANILPVAIASGEVVGTPTLLPGAVAILPTAIPSAEVVGTPTLLPGLVIIAPSAIPTAESVGTPTLVAVATILPTAIPSGEVVGTPTLLPGAVVITPTAIPSAESVGTPTLKAVATILPTAIPSGEVVGTPTLLPGIVSILPTAIASAEVVGTPTLVAVASILPTAIPTGEVVGTPTLLPGNVNIIVGAIPSAESVGVPILVAANPGTLIIQPPSIGSAESVGTPTLIPGAVKILPSAIGSAESVSQPVLYALATISPTAIGSQEALGQPTILKGGVTISPSAIGPGESVGTPSLTTGNVNLNPSAISSQQALGLPILQATNTIAPVAIGSLEALGLPVLIPGQVSILVGAIGSGESIGLPRIIASAVIDVTAGWNWVNRSPGWKNTDLADRPDIQDATKTTQSVGTGSQDGFARTKRNEGDT